MESIWTDEEISESFRTQFHELAARTNGTVEVDTEATLFCAFEPTGLRPAMRVGVYYASGRTTFRFDTTREEIELTVMRRFEIDEDRLVVQSEKGSRTFELDLDGGNWAVTKEPI